MENGDIRVFLQKLTNIIDIDILDNYVVSIVAGSTVISGFAFASSL